MYSAASFTHSLLCLRGLTVTLLVVDVPLCGCIVFHFMNILQCMHSTIGGHFISMKVLSLSFGRQMYSFIWVKEWDCRVIGQTCL